MRSGIRLQGSELSRSCFLSQFHDDRVEHLPHFVGKSFGFVEQLGLTDIECASDDELSLQLEIGPSRDAEKLTVFGDVQPTVAFRDITGNRNGTAPQLAR